MGKKSMVLLSCLVIFASSVSAIPEQEHNPVTDVKGYERTIGKLPKPLSYQGE